MNPNTFSNDAAARLILRVRKRSARFDAADAEQFAQLAQRFEQLGTGSKLTPQEVVLLHKLAEKCGA